MTLDDFQKTVSASVDKFKAELLDHIQKGIEAKLDQELMLIIINREIERMLQQ